MGTLTSWGPVVLGLAAVVISVAAFVQANRVAKREAYVVASDILADLTLGEIGHARDVIGTLRYGNATGWQALDYSDLINQYYLLQWSLERVGFSLRGLRPAGHEVQKSMIQAIKWHIKELVGSLSLVHAAFGRDMVDDDSWAHLKTMVKEIGLEMPTLDAAQAQEVAHRVQFLCEHSIAATRPHLTPMD